MNEMPNEREMDSVWRGSRDAFRVSPIQLILAALICLLACLTLPFCTSEPFSIAVTAAMLAYVVIFGRKPLAVTGIVFSTFLVFSVTASFPLTAIFLSLVAGACAGAFLLSVSRLPYLFALIPIASFAFVMIQTQDLWRAALTLFWIPAALLLAYATVSERTRTSVICFCAGGLLLSTAVAVLIWLRLQCGSLDRAAIIAYVESLRAALVQLLVDLRESLLKLAQESGEAGAQQLGQQISKIMSATAITAAVDQFLNLLPAMVVVLCSVIAFEAQMLLNTGYATVGLHRVVTRESSVFTVSVTASVLYAASFLLLLFVPSGVFTAVLQNVTLILMPGLCLVGFRALAVMLFRANGGMRLMLLILVLFMLCCSSGSMLYILAMWGAYANVSAAIHRALAKKLSQMRDGDGPDDTNF